MVLDDPCLELLAELPLSAAPEAVFAQLRDDTAWQQETILLWGKRIPQPRLTAWVGDADAAYTYSGLHLEPQPWPPLLTALRERVQAASGAAFNSVLLNLYRDGRDSMGLHSDDEPELGLRPVIASLSLGAEREILFRHKTRRDLKLLRLPLPSGSLLIMRGDTQRDWKHGIEKTRQPCGPRINLTFRQIRRPRLSSGQQPG
jgi:alkylated DNA repair dioxygenase AlkB